MKCLAQSKGSVNVISSPPCWAGVASLSVFNTWGVGGLDGLTLLVPQLAESRAGQAGAGQGD